MLANVTTRMTSQRRAWIPRCLLGWLLAIVTAGVSLSIGTSGAWAAITTFGSQLSVPATLNTAQSLGYEGTNTKVPPSPEAPEGVFHTPHDGADTALWNASLASGLPAAPAAGQALKVSLEGCAQPAAGGPAPLTQVHFQDLSPLPGGGAKVNVTSQPFNIPVCGQSGVSGSTVTTYEPENLCVAQGDYVDFNDEGGYVENIYRSGVPYQVIGATRGSTMDSFIRGGGTGNGATMSSTDRTSHDGFAANESEELMLQTTLGTGPDATPLCPGGTRGETQSAPPPSHSTSGKKEPSTAASLGKQTDGVNHLRIVRVAIYCRLSATCTGLATLTNSRHAGYGSSHFSIPGRKTSLVPIRVAKHVIALLRKHRSGVLSSLSLVINGATVRQTIRLML